MLTCSVKMEIFMNITEILAKVDHTLLTQTATLNEIKIICDDAIQYSTASVCIPPAYVKEAYEYVHDKIPICTVIGFPNGNMTTAVKCFEAKNAIENGASEIDMVINIGWLKDGRYDDISKEIESIKAVCANKILKVIIETYFLSDEEKIKMCGIVTQTGADFIKTSTGFANAGATFKDIALFAANVGANVKIKAAGGISSFEDAQKFIELGASRLGTSRLVNIVKALK